MTLAFGKFKGTEFSKTPIWYQNWLNSQSWFKQDNIKPLHKQLSGWDGHGRKGQAIYDNIFEQEMAMQNSIDAHEYEPGGKYFGI